MAIIELTPPTGDYLTQANLAEEESRIFVKKIAGHNINASDWRDATASEKEEWEKAYLPTND